MAETRGKRQDKENRPDPKSSPEPAVHIGLGSAHTLNRLFRGLHLQILLHANAPKIDTQVLLNTDNTVTSAINQFKDPPDTGPSSLPTVLDGFGAPIQNLLLG